MVSTIAQSIELLGWSVWENMPELARSRIMSRYTEVRKLSADLLALAISCRLEELRILSRGCELSDDVCRFYMKLYEKRRRDEARRAATASDELPPVPEKYRAEVADIQRKLVVQAIEDVDKDIASERTRIQELQHFDRKTWGLLASRLWYMSRRSGLLDRFLFWPRRGGRDRFMRITMSGKEHILRLMFLQDAVDCKFEPVWCENSSAREHCRTGHANGSF